jgi:hypothetical protein
LDISAASNITVFNSSLPFAALTGSGHCNLNVYGIFPVPIIVYTGMRIVIFVTPTTVVTNLLGNSGTSDTIAFSLTGTGFEGYL